ncbi:MAG: GDSL-type esterase/lipase family protein [Armatimonadota bacterium]
MRRVFGVLSLLIIFSGSAWCQGNLLRNPGFEALSGQGFADWTNPQYWSGTFAPVETPAEVHGGKRAGLLGATLKQDRHWGRIHSMVVPVTYGLNYSFSLWAKGSGTVKLGAINYSEGKPGQPNYVYVWQEKPVALTDQWQQINFDFAPTGPDIIRVAVTAELEGENAAASLDDGELIVSRKFPGSITSPPYMMVSPGATVTLEITARRDDQQPLASILAGIAGTSDQQPLTLAADGTARYSVAIPAEAPLGLQRVDFISADLGVAATSYVDVVDPKTLDEFAAAAKAAEMQAPCHLLFLGDSLTDFSRGFNYTDQVSYWLAATKGDITYRNAGVGGDYITRMQQRLNGDKTVYRLNAYDNLLSPIPQRIFIMLGHNDSKLSSGSGFTEPVVSLADYEKQFKEVIERLRKDTGAHITLLSNTSSVYEITKRNADATVAKGKGASLFGKPEVMEQFNEVLRKVAADTGCDYVDLYEPTRTHPDKPSLFTADGVHMTLAGNHVVALELLRHLSK